NWVKDNYTATYTVGGKTVYLNSWQNRTKIVYIDDIAPDPDGKLLLDFSTTEAAGYGFNAGIIISSYTYVPGPPDTIPDGPDPIDPIPGNPYPIDTIPGNPDPIDTIPGSPDPIDTIPGNPDPIDTIPGKPDSIDTIPVNADPIDTISVHTDNINTNDV